jgi:hypothetical protein
MTPQLEAARKELAKNGNLVIFFGNGDKFPGADRPMLGTVPT